MVLINEGSDRTNDLVTNNYGRHGLLETLVGGIWHKVLVCLEDDNLAISLDESYENGASSPEGSGTEIPQCVGSQKRTVTISKPENSGLGISIKGKY